MRKMRESRYLNSLALILGGAALICLATSLLPRRSATRKNHLKKCPFVNLNLAGSASSIRKPKNALRISTAPSSQISSGACQKGATRQKTTTACARCNSRSNSQKEGRHSGGEEWRPQRMGVRCLRSEVRDRLLAWAWREAPDRGWGAWGASVRVGWTCDLNTRDSHFTSNLAPEV